MTKAQGDTSDKDPIRQDRSVDSSGNPVERPSNVNLDTILDDGITNGVGTGSGKLPRDGR
jgi:hypothetical protein